VAELINIASDENIKLVGIHSSEFRLQSKMEKKVSFQALQANELIKFLPKKEVFAPPPPPHPPPGPPKLRCKKDKICYSA
jgi:hypothetical protein